MKQVQYVGKAEYCYANAAAMLLDSTGETVRPEVIEVGCGIGLSAFVEQESGNLFFSPFVTAPDQGLDQALKMLGFQTAGGSFADASALDDLRQLVESGPVVIGPVDMGYLDYNPRRAAGADHFVLVYGFEEGEFLIHDPYGYPNARLAGESLRKAWKAESIGYKKNAFQYWHSPRRIKRPGETQLRAEVWRFFKGLYSKIRKVRQADGFPLGPPAITQFANALEAGSLAVSAEGFLTGFQLPLAAKRAGDYAAFFADNQPEFAKCKLSLADQFGRTHCYLMREDRPAAARSLYRIAELETRIAELLA